MKEGGADRQEIYGKWLVFRHLDRIDETWEKVCRALAKGRLGGCISAKCSTKRYNPTRSGPGPCTTAHISVYTEEGNIDAIGFKLIEIVRQDIKYKTDEDTQKLNFVHTGAGRVAKKTLYWNRGRPSFERLGAPCYGKSYQREDSWKINIVTAPKLFESKERYGWWIVYLDYDKMTELWHYLKDRIESSEEDFGVLKMECPAKEVRYSPTEKPKFYLSTSSEDKSKVGMTLIELVQRDIDYRTVKPGGGETLFWNNGKPSSKRQYPD